MEGEEEMLSQLRELQLVLAWVLLSLAHCDRVGKKKEKKKQPRLEPLPFPELLVWLSTAVRHCTRLTEVKMNTLCG